MPLEKGQSKEVIGHNVKEMEQHGHPKEQAVAAALHTAYDFDEMVAETMIGDNMMSYGGGYPIQTPSGPGDEPIPASAKPATAFLTDVEPV
jgi:hypothetical protein